MRVAVIQFPGSNCDDDARQVLAGLDAQVSMVWHLTDYLGEVDAVVLPGGFSYGDYLRSGAMAALSPIMTAVKEFAARGGAVVGICNGFQVLTEAGLLPGQLAANPKLHFLCHDVYLKVEKTSTLFSRQYAKGQVLKMPVAHNDGRYYADEATLARLEANGQILFRYCEKNGTVSQNANPNGSLNNIAGILNERGNVLGMMPHPERASEVLLGSADGLALFESLLSGSVGASLLTLT